MTYQLHHGDCINIMPLIERESVDAVICDPPYGLGFMGKDWDHGVPGMHFWLEALRCAKPGAYLLAFGGTRTFHRLAVAIEDAGWEIRDTVMWVYGQGFPKSHDVSKAIDKSKRRDYIEVAVKLGMNLPDNSHWDWTKGEHSPSDAWWEKFKQVLSAEDWQRIEREVIGNEQKKAGWFTARYEYDVTSPATPAAAEWDGWGTALKPAWEPIIVARKPLQGTVAENVQRYGTGAMNIDACRIETESRPLVLSNRRNGNNTYGDGLEGSYNAGDTSQGRWPANLIHDGSAEVLAGFPVTTESTAHNRGRKMRGWLIPVDGSESVRGFSDTGSAARFFYCAKASKQDRDEGCELLELVEIKGDVSIRQNGVHGQTGKPNSPLYSRNHHPTVKPTALMRYLCRLVTPPQGVILDPFMGSGSTGKAAMLEGFNFIGIDTEIEYVEIAARRIEHACEKVGIVIDQPMMFETQRETADRPKQLMLL